MIEPTSPRTAPSVSAIVLAYGSEPWLEDCVAALLASEGNGEIEVVLVDNGCSDGAVDRLAPCPGIVILRQTGNLGFAGGCNAGARVAKGDVLVFVNGDAIVAPGAVDRLAAVASRPGVGIATASVRLAQDPDRLNSAGNEIHFLGVGWAGRFNEPAAAYPEEVEVTGASGAGMAMSREVWERLGGFDDAYFAYHEDAELSLRCWQQGLSVVYVPDAVVLHRYEFSKNPNKLYLLERNRLIFVLTLFEVRTLLLLAPAFVALELGILALAVRDGWARQKLAGWAWLVRNRRWVKRRRLDVQADRTASDRVVAARLSGRLRSENVRLPGVLQPADWLLALYWALVRRLL
jgi:GT2 family glycosyltransferase